MIVCMTKLGSQIVKVVTCSTDFRVLIPELLPYKDRRPKTEDRRTKTPPKRRPSRKRRPRKRRARGGPRFRAVFAF